MRHELSLVLTSEVVRPSDRLARLVRDAARRIREDTQCEYCSPGVSGCHMCTTKIAVAKRKPSSSQTQHPRFASRG